MRLARPGRRTDRRTADPRPRDARRRRARRRLRDLDGPRGDGRDHRHQHGVVPDDPAAVHHLRARPGDAADQGLPPRPRPAAAHPEHRAPRRPRLARHQRRRPGQPVPGLRRPDLRRQRRPGAGRHRRDAVLQLAARARRLGLLRRRSSCRCATSSASSPRPTASYAARSASCCRRSPSPSSAPPSCGPTPSRPAPRTASTTPSTSSRGRAPGPRGSRRSRSPSAGSRPASPTPVSSSSAIWLGFADDITAGEVLAFAFLVTLFVGPVQMGTQILTDAQNAIAGWRRVIGILDTPADLVDPGPDGAEPAARPDRRALRAGRLRLPRRARSCCATSTLDDRRRAPGWPSSARPARASPPSPSCSPG